MGNNLIEEYKGAFSKYRNYVYEINDIRSQTITHKGYLVNYDDYLNFEKFINELDKQSKQNESQTNISFESKKLRTVNINEVKNKIVNDNKYIIINRDLHEKICMQK